jgi:hypothetical protein
VFCLENVTRGRISKIVLSFFIWAVSLSGQLGAQDKIRYTVDPAWPKELPNNWIKGPVDHLIVDKRNHIWVFHPSGLVRKDEAGLAQKSPTSECCRPAPQILEFDSQGNVIKSWVGPDLEPQWPAGAGGLWVDDAGNIWMTAGGRRVGMHVPRPEVKNLPWGGGNILKCSPGGRLLLEIGHDTRPDGLASNSGHRNDGSPFGT